MTKCLTIRFLKPVLLLLCWLIASTQIAAQPSPYAGFLDGMPLRQGELFWQTSGFLNHFRVGVNKRLSVGFAPLPSTFIDQSGLDWNFSARWTHEVAPHWWMGWEAFYWRSHYDDNYYLSNGDYKAKYVNFNVHLTHGDRYNNLGLHTGLWHSGFWGHYIFSDDAFGGELFDFPDIGDIYTAPFVALTMRHTEGPWSGGLEASYWRNRRAQGALVDAVLSYTWPGIRLEYGVFHASQRQKITPSTFFISRGLQYTFLPLVNVYVALNGKTYRYWREDARAARY